RERLEVRARCAWNWITQFSPEDFRFSLQGEDDPAVDLGGSELKALSLLNEEVETLDTHTEKTIGEAIYKIAEECSLQPKDLFTVVYRVLIGKEKGPRLAGFMMIVGKEKLSAILKRYL
ncbi:MAG: lysine--tRNA ligase, partial [Spirochaetes bacterium]